MRRDLTAIGVTGALGIGVLATVPQSFWPKCPIYWTTGIYCPGCGGLRATSALLQGDLAAAANQNILIFLIPLLVGAGFLIQNTGKRGLNKVFIAFVVLISLAYTILRNVPDSWFAPDITGLAT